MRNQIKFDDKFYKFKTTWRDECYVLQCHPKIYNYEIAKLLDLEYIDTGTHSFMFTGEKYNYYNQRSDIYHVKTKLDAYQLLSSGTVRKDTYCNPIVYQEVLGDEIFGKIQTVLNAN